MSKEDYYQTLGVSRSASDSEIKSISQAGNETPSRP